MIATPPFAGLGTRRLPKWALRSLATALLCAGSPRAARADDAPIWDPVPPEDLAALPKAWTEATARVHRPDGVQEEPRVSTILTERLGHEWEWEDTPEVSLKIVETVEEAVGLFNAYSPRFCASLIAEDDLAQRRFFEAVDAPFVGDGFTRWVDGQYALNRPELGLSNWQNGRLLARGGVLAGDSVFTVRARVRQTDLALDRQTPAPPQDLKNQTKTESHVVRGTAQTRP